MTEDAEATSEPQPDPTQKRWFGHPRGLATLFFTEMWERFSYYGMRGLLQLFMVAPVASGGLGFTVDKAGSIYGLYTALVYLGNLPGGWIADKFLGQRRSVLFGGMIIASGHFSMTVPSIVTFYVGLCLIVIGTGLLKPNISVMVGQLYTDRDAQRDAGFSIFYMGINLGAFIAPLVCGFLGEKVNWHYGFGLAGVGMVAGLIQYVFGGKYLGKAGLRAAGFDPEGRARDVRRLKRWAAFIAVLIGVPVVLALTGVLTITEQRISNAFGVILALIVIGFFGWLFLGGQWTREERKRLYVIAVLFVGAALFWSAFEQAGSTMNLFAADNTDRSYVLPGFVLSTLQFFQNAAVTVGNWFGLWNPEPVPQTGTFPASWFQSLNPLFIILLAPLFALLWVGLSRRDKEPASPAKFSIGLFLLALGFVVLIVASVLGASGVLVSPSWLFTAYLLHTLGELCLSPVGLSAMTKLAPVRVGSLMMGVWFLAASVGNYMGGFISRFYESLALPTLFGIITLFGIGGAIIMALVARPIRRMLERAD